MSDYTPDIPHQAIQSVSELAETARKVYKLSPTQRAQAIIDSFRPNWNGGEFQWVALRAAIAQQIAASNDELLRSVQQQESGLGAK
jgi:hypothetical protein